MQPGESSGQKAWARLSQEWAQSARLLLERDVLAAVWNCVKGNARKMLMMCAAASEIELLA
jgi:hypothetical protein